MLTVLGAVGVAWLAPTIWTTTSTMVIEPPPAAPTEGQLESDPALQRLNADNPLTRRYDPTTIITILASRITSEAGRSGVEARGGTADFDIQQLQVFDAGDRIVFRLRTRDLSPTFGSPLGPQLVDVYVHVPGAPPTSTAAMCSPTEC